MDSLKNRIIKIHYVYSIYVNIRNGMRELKRDVSIIGKILFAKYFRRNIHFLVLTPVHGNLGDHAIAKAEAELLTTLGISYYEVSGKDLSYLEKHNKLGVFNHKPILLNGGGYLGTLWFNDERLVRNLILSNPDSHILLFPNTVVYENSEFGKAEFQKASEIYHNHKRLKIYVRENISLPIIKELCDHVGFAPDMAMRLREDNDNTKRSGCTLFLRKDKECTRSKQETEQIIQSAHHLFGKNVWECDTVLPHGVPVAERDIELNRLFDVYRTSELVITDRLHGMIFGAITGTPTIVVNSRSPKVMGCYEWLKHLAYIRACLDLSEIEELFFTMPHGGQKYDNRELMAHYDELFDDLRNISKKKWSPC